MIQMLRMTMIAAAAAFAAGPALAQTTVAPAAQPRVIQLGSIAPDARLPAPAMPRTLARPVLSRASVLKAAQASLPTVKNLKAPLLKVTPAAFGAGGAKVVSFDAASLMAGVGNYLIVNENGKLYIDLGVLPAGQYVAELDVGGVAIDLRSSDGKTQTLTTLQNPMQPTLLIFKSSGVSVDYGVGLHLTAKTGTMTFHSLTVSALE